MSGRWIAISIGSRKSFAQAGCAAGVRFRADEVAHFVEAIEKLCASTDASQPHASVLVTGQRWLVCATTDHSGNRPSPLPGSGRLTHGCGIDILLLSQYGYSGVAMRFPTIFRYGARALVELAATYPARAVSTREIGEKQGLSAKYLEQILRALKARGLVQAVRGKHGGYVLTRAPAAITLKDLYESVNGVLAPAHCVAQPDLCPLRDVCPVWDTFVEVRDAVDNVLGRTTIQDLLTRIEQKSASRDSKSRAGVSAPTSKRPRR